MFPIPLRLSRNSYYTWCYGICTRIKVLYLLPLWFSPYNSLKMYLPLCLFSQISPTLHWVFYYILFPYTREGIWERLQHLSLLDCKTLYTPFTPFLGLLYELVREPNIFCTYTLYSKIGITQSVFTNTKCILCLNKITDDNRLCCTNCKKTMHDECERKYNRDKLVYFCPNCGREGRMYYRNHRWLHHLMLLLLHFSFSFLLFFFTMLITWHTLYRKTRKIEPFL